jgi:hypothetical protein
MNLRLARAVNCSLGLIVMGVLLTGCVKKKTGLERFADRIRSTGDGGALWSNAIIFLETNTVYGSLPSSLAPEFTRSHVSGYGAPLFVDISSNSLAILYEMGGFGSTGIRIYKDLPSEPLGDDPSTSIHWTNNIWFFRSP